MHPSRVSSQADITVEGCTGFCCQLSQVLTSSSCEIVMSDHTEQRICLRFCFHLGKTAKEAHEMLQRAFKEEALSRTQVFEWFARFKRGEMSVENHPHSGRPSTSRTDENVEKINEDYRYTIDEIYRCELEFLSADFDRGFEHETRCREVCSLPAHTGPKKHSSETPMHDLYKHL